VNETDTQLEDISRNQALLVQRFDDLKIGERMHSLEIWRAYITGGLVVLSLLMSIFGAMLFTKLDKVTSVTAQVETLVRMHGPALHGPAQHREE